MICLGCDKDHREENMAPYIRYADNSLGWACRHCLSGWLKRRILYPSIPFWARQQGFDR